MVTYQQLHEQIQKRFNDFPLGFAFSDEQFKEMMRKWGLSENDTDKIVRIGNGGFCRKSDLDEYHKLCSDSDKELNEALKNDDFFFDACKYELANHEYAYNPYQGNWEVLQVLGFELRKPGENEDEHDEDFFNNENNFIMSEHQRELYKKARHEYLIEFYKAEEQESYDEEWEALTEDEKEIVEAFHNCYDSSEKDYNKIINDYHIATSKDWDIFVQEEFEEMLMCSGVDRKNLNWIMNYVDLESYKYELEQDYYHDQIDDNCYIFRV